MVDSLVVTCMRVQTTTHLQGVFYRRLNPIGVLILILVSHHVWNIYGSTLTLQQTRLSSKGLAPPFGSYFQRNYANMTDEFKRLATSPECSKILFVVSAQELYRDRKGVHLDSEFFNCGSRRCETLFVRIASKIKLQPDTPEVFLSGALHGDERLGPNTLFELTRLFCHMYGRHPIITFLANTRAIWMTPITNSWGYAHNSREENGIDPNRDFPYLRPPSSCMATIAARALNELFLDHLFQLSITFHGGTRVMGYEWGSFDHENKYRIYSSHKSSESPDLTSQRDISLALQEAAGWLEPHHKFEKKEHYGYRRLTENRVEKDKEVNRRNKKIGESREPSDHAIVSEDWNTTKIGPGEGWFYPIGSMTDLVYPVNGGFEDWSYSSSWQKSPDPISICAPTTYGGYPTDRTNYSTTDSLRSSTFLVEMDYLKNPPDWQFGHSAEIMNPSGFDGHISRNIRLILKLVELVEPNILLIRPPKLIKISTNENNDHSKEEYQLTMALLPIGCRRLDKLQLILMKESCSTTLRSNLRDPSFVLHDTLGRFVELIDNSMNCSGIGIWEDWHINDITLKWNDHSLNRKAIVPVNLKISREEFDSKNRLCVMARGVFDQHWSFQISPDPPIEPQTHVVKTRMLKSYEAFAGKQIINSTRIKLFPYKQAWGSKWITGIDLSIPKDNVQVRVDSNSADQTILTASLPFRPFNFSRERSSPVWTVQFTSLSGMLSDQVFDFQWDPFSASLKSSIEGLASVDFQVLSYTTKGATTFNGPPLASITRLDLLISHESLQTISSPTEFVLRAWSSKEALWLGNPLELHSLSHDDGEVARWKITPDGRLIMGSTHIGLSPSLAIITNSSAKDFSSNNPTDDMVQISFSPRVPRPKLLPLRNLVGHLLTLEMIPLKDAEAFLPTELEKEIRSPTSISFVLPTFKDPSLVTSGGSTTFPPLADTESESQRELLCVFRMPSVEPVVTFKPGRLSPTWYHDSSFVEQEIESQTNGFIILSWLNKSKVQIAGEICRLKSEKNATHDDLISITSDSECSITPIQVKRPLHHFLNPLQERLFPVWSHQSVNSVGRCRQGTSSWEFLYFSGQTLNTVLISNNQTYAKATCRLESVTRSSKFYLRKFCNPKTLKPLHDDIPTLPQRIAVGFLGVGFLVCSLLPIVDVLRMKRLIGYSPVHSSASIFRNQPELEIPVQITIFGGRVHQFKY